MASVTIKSSLLILLLLPQSFAGVPMSIGQSRTASHVIRRSEASDSQAGINIAGARPVDHDGKGEPDKKLVTDFFIDDDRRHRRDRNYVLMLCSYVKNQEQNEKKECKASDISHFTEAYTSFCSKVDGFVFKGQNKQNSVSMDFGWQGEDDSGTISVQVDMALTTKGSLVLNKDRCNEGFGALPKYCGKEANGGRNNGYAEYNRGGQMMPQGNWGNDELIYTLNAYPKADDKCHFNANVVTGDRVLKLSANPIATRGLAPRGEAKDAQAEMKIENSGNIDHKGDKYPKEISHDSKGVGKVVLTCTGATTSRMGHLCWIGFARKELLPAIDDICNAANGFVFANGNQKTSLYKEYHGTYEGAGQYNITTQIDKLSSDTKTLTLTKASCIESLKTIVDRCDESGVDAKRGGQLRANRAWGNDDLQYTLMPYGAVHDGQDLCVMPYDVEHGEKVLKLGKTGEW